MITERLYYTDATLVEFTATVREHDATRCRMVLDRSAFYPTSGGQPHDTGLLAGIPVIDVLEEHDEVIHVLESPLPAGVTQVTGVIDWSRRYDLMQQHSGQHLLSALFEDHFGWPTVSVHFGAESATLDLASETIDAGALREAERMANVHVTENREISVAFESADTATGLRKPSERGGLLRIVSIDGLDKNACGGTHVNRTGAIGPILLRKSERVRGATRVEFRCGARAVARARADCDITQQIAIALSAAAEETPSLVTSLQSELRAASKERARLLEQLAAFEARALYDTTAPAANGRRVHVVHLTDTPVASQQTMAQQFILGQQAVFIASSAAPAAVLLAASEDSALDAGRLLREALQQVGGRGGGTPRVAQGSAPSADAARACAQALEVIARQ